ncbi:MAG: helix-turn-helix domain-containing protein [Tannerellaceae bacterium]|nr:helix-turn-helix domain-containing protein [Tannerellaceae bacterium]
MITESRLSEKVKLLCKIKGIAQKDLAEKMGILPESLNRAIKGNPHLSTLYNIANALEVDVTELFETPKKTNVKGYLEIEGVITPIHNLEDLVQITERLVSTFKEGTCLGEFKKAF